MSPAPKVRIRSPSCTRSASSAGTSPQLGTKDTARCPEALAALTTASPDTPAIGDSRDG
jgi:hypothetical protein